MSDLRTYREQVQRIEAATEQVDKNGANRIYTQKRQCWSEEKKPGHHEDYETTPSLTAGGMLIQEHPQKGRPIQQERSTYGE